MGKKVIQIGCESEGRFYDQSAWVENHFARVMNYMREEDEEPEKLEDISREDSEAFSVLKQAVRHRDLGVPEEELLRHSSFWRI